MAEQTFELISVEEFARRMSVSRSTVFIWLAKGYFAKGLSKHPPAEPGAFKIVNRSKRCVQKII